MAQEFEFLKCQATSNKNTDLTELKSKFLTLKKNIISSGCTIIGDWGVIFAVFTDCSVWGLSYCHGGKYRTDYGS